MNARLGICKGVASLGKGLWTLCLDSKFYARLRLRECVMRTPGILKGETRDSLQNHAENEKWMPTQFQAWKNGNIGLVTFA